MPPAISHGRALTAVTRAVTRRPLLVVVAWLVLAAGCFAVGLGVFTRLEPDVGVVPGSQSDRAYTLLGQAGPQPVELTEVITGWSTSDPTLPDSVARAVADIRRMPSVAEVTEPMPSPVTREALLVRIYCDPTRPPLPLRTRWRNGCGASTTRPSCGCCSSQRP